MKAHIKRVQWWTPTKLTRKYTKHHSSYVRAKALIDSLLGFKSWTYFKEKCAKMVAYGCVVIVILTYLKRGPFETIACEFLLRDTFDELGPSVQDLFTSCPSQKRRYKMNQGLALIRPFKIPIGAPKYTQSSVGDNRKWIVVMRQELAVSTIQSQREIIQFRSYVKSFIEIFLSNKKFSLMLISYILFFGP